MQEFDVLKQLVADTEADIQKVDSGNVSAGTRARKAMQAIKKQAQTVRDKVMSLRETNAPKE